MDKKYQLPSMETTFDISVVGSDSRIPWAGKFKYRRPNLREKGLIEILRARLNGDLTTIDIDVAALNEALAYLKHTLKDFPDWWKDMDFGGNLHDPNVVLEIYSKCMIFEAEWLKKMKGGDAKDVEAKDGTSPEPLGANS